MPLPIMEPATSITASNKVRERLNPGMVVVSVYKPQGRAGADEELAIILASVPHSLHQCGRQCNRREQVYVPFIPHLPRNMSCTAGE